MQLVINTFGASLRKEGDRFLVQAGDKKLAVSAHKVQSILIATSVHFSSDAILLASQHNIDVIFLDSTGDTYGRVWQTRMGSTAAIRRRQLEVAEAPEGLALVKDWVEAKLRHQLEFIEELARRRTEREAEFEPVTARLRECLARLSALAGTIDERRATIMGVEGTAGRVYFTCLSRLVPEAYRRPQPPSRPRRLQRHAQL
jgi:CRISPR-associated protein Cas1